MANNSEVRRTDNGQFVRALPFGRNGASLAGFSPDDRLIYSISGNGKLVHFWGLKRSQRKWELLMTTTTSDYQKPHFTRTPGVLAFATTRGVELRRVPTGKILEKLNGPRNEPFELAPDENSAVSCDVQGRV